MRRALEGLPGMRQVSVSLEGDSATPEYQPDRVAPKELEAAVRKVVLLPGLRRSIEQAARPRRRERP